MPSQRTTLLLSFALACFSMGNLAFAHEGHEGKEAQSLAVTSDMTMMGMPSMMGVFHTTIGMDTLWFSGWMPQSSGATAGAALGLALIAIMSRVIAAFRSSLEHSWRLQSGHLVAESKELPLVSRLSSHSDMASESFDESQVELQQTSSVTPQGQAQALVAAYRLAPAFNPSRDLTRGLMHAFSAFVGYLLMLAVMTTNAWFFIAIILGLGLGEVACGRYTVLETH